ncbi:alpha/beta fold hydrolase [Streptomyces sp. WI04-05B]|uniref:alpha/beta fold hydrolase n=1 Tax=Streptomyces TaxID=1883 RepID=UPI0029BD24A1|nr:MULTISPECIES: alpha/beta fold hydrolase [unclassified Streptomyces]MDX2547623.1 alpha/beta fold hydrolase [Streptomyces sp. WI04-05B]MDX2590121.1 alpha/beta fold hydrolase [Streptomyces sp. WI04-05A]
MTAPVLALEFPGTGTGDSTDFAFLAEAVGRHCLRRVDPLVFHTGPPRSLADQARELASETPRLVLAHCSAAALGLRVAGLSGVPLILVDPDPVAEDYLRQEFAVLFRRLGHDPDPVLDLAGFSTGEELTGYLESALFGVADTLAEEYGGDDEARVLARDLLGRYRAWLRFLGASTGACPAYPDVRVTIVAGKPLPPLTTLLVDPGSALIHHVPVEPGGTLDSPEIRDLLCTLASGGRPAEQFTGEQ